MYTILICDDDRDIVSALDIYLTSEGYRTIAAYNGREAIQAAEENEIHLIPVSYTHLTLPTICSV